MPFLAPIATRSVLPDASWPLNPCLQESGLAGYEQLYNDSMRRRMKLEALAAQPPEEATFRPRVSLGAVGVATTCLREQLAGAGPAP